MEERIIDDEEARLIKIKRTKNGEDAVEDTGEQPETEPQPEDEEAFPDDFTVEFADDEDYDEELVGLTPSQLKEVLERREREARAAREKCDAYTQSGREFLEKGDYESAEGEFQTALSYVFQDETAHALLWQARTKNHTDTEAYYKRENVTELLSAPEQVRKDVLARDGEKLKSERDTLKEEIVPLRAEVLKKRSERREPLLRNKNYYRLRLYILLALFVCCAIAAAISAYYTVRTTSIAPIVTAAIFGAGAGIGLILSVVYTRFWLVALRLFNANESTNSTEEGRKLSALEERESCLALLLDEEEAEAAE